MVRRVAEHTPDSVEVAVERAGHGRLLGGGVEDWAERAPVVVYWHPERRAQCVGRPLDHGPVITAVPAEIETMRGSPPRHCGEIGGKGEARAESPRAGAVDDPRSAELASR